MKKRRLEDKKQNGTKVWSAALALLAAEVSIFVVRSKQLIVDNFLLISIRGLETGARFVGTDGAVLEGYPSPLLVWSPFSISLYIVSCCLSESSERFGGRGVSDGRARVGLKPFPTRIPRPPCFPFPVSCSSQPSVPCVFLSCSWILQEETPGGTGNCVQCPPQPHDERDHEVNILENILPKRGIIITGKK